jgi:hypothetical protein
MKYKQYSYKSKMAAYLLGVADAKAALYETKEMEDPTNNSTISKQQQQFSRIHPTTRSYYSNVAA